MDRLDIHDVAGLVRFAIRSGLIASSPDHLTYAVEGCCQALVNIATDKLR